MGKKKKVVIDTNTLISALGWEGNPRKVLDKVTEGEIIIFMSPAMVDELKKVMCYPHLHFTEEQKSGFLKIVLEVAEIVKPKIKMDIVKEDPVDNMFLECGLAAKADFIVSGDKHLRKIKSIKGIKIVSPREFLDF